MKSEFLLAGPHLSPWLFLVMSQRQAMFGRVAIRSRLICEGQRRSAGARELVNNVRDAIERSDRATLGTQYIRTASAATSEYRVPVRNLTIAST
jgi:hypothetical protein